MKMLYRIGMAAAAMLAGASAAHAQNAVQEVVAVPPGFTVVMVPAGGAPMEMMPALPDPAMMLRQAEAMMAAAQAGAFPSPETGLAQAALRQMPAVNGPIASEMVTTVSDGSTTCTERVVYPANGGKVQLSAVGNGCDQASLPGTTDTVTPGATPGPAAVPALQVAPKPAAPAPQLVVAENN